MSTNRICIYPKDIQLVTGKSERTARRILSDIKMALGKGQNQFVSLNEFCEFTGLHESEVRNSLIY